MPSLALGKLLSNDASKKPRVRSINGDPSIVQHYSSELYTPNHSKKRQATDDYGFPVTFEPEDSNADTRNFNKESCRTCNRSHQVSTSLSWKCEQCHTTNGAKLTNSKNSHQIPKPIPSNEIHILLDQLLAKSRDQQDHFSEPLKSVYDESRTPNFNRSRTFGSPSRPSGSPSRPSGSPSRPSGSPSRSSASPIRRRGSAPEVISDQAHLTKRKGPGIITLPPSQTFKESPSLLAIHGLTANAVEPITPLSLSESTPSTPNNHPRRRRPSEHSKSLYQPLLDYYTQSLTRQTLNCSFSSIRPHNNNTSENKIPLSVKKSSPDQSIRINVLPPSMAQMEHKDFMVGDVYDVASSLVGERSSPSKKINLHPKEKKASGPKLVSQGSPHIDWKSLLYWYDAIITPSKIQRREKQINSTNNHLEIKVPMTGENLDNIARDHILDQMENLLSCSQDNAIQPQDIRYLLILLTNPLIATPKEYTSYYSRRKPSNAMPNNDATPNPNQNHDQNQKHKQPSSSSSSSSSSSLSPPSFYKQKRILSLILGQISNLSSDCHHHLIQWFSRYPEDIFKKQIDTILTFINDRILSRTQSSRSKRPNKSQNFGGLPASQLFNDVLKADMMVPINNDRLDDWQLRAACKVLQLFFRANDIFQTKNGPNTRLQSSSSTTRKKQLGKQLLPTNYFYISQLDSKRFDAAQDYNDWERKESGFQLTKYPFLLTLGTKICMLEFDAKKKMASKAREEFFDAILRNAPGQSGDKFFHLNVRRKCLIEDSLQRISEALSGAEGEAKKALKVHFEGEEGVDAGGLRKEWFLFLVRELLDPAVGLFLYNEETGYCYFNANSLESSEQYQLVGAVLGLAIYNFTILDVPFPPFLFRKLMAAAPPSMGIELHQGWRPSWRPELKDLAQYDPALARNLQYVLDYKGNITEDIGLVFQIDSDAYGKVHHSSLVTGGENRVVNKKNREEYVDLYVEYILDKSIRRQFEPFARGFFNVCGGNALSLFKGEEVELLIRGSGDLDFMILRGSATYENWRVNGPNSPEVTLGQEVEAKFPVIKWFWELMSLSETDDQRRVLRWITGSDRIPATGMGSLNLVIQCLGEDGDRLPQSRTCFNMLQLWNYKSRLCFIRKFWYAVVESEGFGMK